MRVFKEGMNFTDYYIQMLIMSRLRSLFFAVYFASYELAPTIFNLLYKIKYKIEFPSSGICFDKIPFIPFNLKVGKHSHSGLIHISYNQYCTVIIGNNTHIGRDVEFLLYSDHSVKDIDFNEAWDKPHALEIGDSVWIGDKVIIIGSRKIGSNTTIGAGTVVRKDILPNSIVIGNPAIFNGQ